MGIGAGAHSKITPLNNFKIQRYRRVQLPKQYLQAKQGFIAEQKIVNTKELIFEFMLNALRLHSPIPLSLFYERTGLALTDIKKTLDLAAQQGLLDHNEQFIIITPLGRRFLNDLYKLFLD